jgi:hypothetical protein
MPDALNDAIFASTDAKAVSDPGPIRKAVLDEALADRPDGLPPGIEAALEAAARGLADRDPVLVWDELRPGDRAELKSRILAIVVDACRGQIEALR